MDWHDLHLLKKGTLKLLPFLILKCCNLTSPSFDPVLRHVFSHMGEMPNCYKYNKASFMEAGLSTWGCVPTMSCPPSFWSFFGSLTVNIYIINCYSWMERDPLNMCLWKPRAPAALEPGKDTEVEKKANGRTPVAVTESSEMFANGQQGILKVLVFSNYLNWLEINADTRPKDGKQGFVICTWNVLSMVHFDFEPEFYNLWITLMHSWTLNSKQNFLDIYHEIICGLIWRVYKIVSLFTLVEFGLYCSFCFWDCISL